MNTPMSILLFVALILMGIAAIGLTLRGISYIKGSSEYISQSEKKYRQEIGWDFIAISVILYLVITITICLF